MQLLSTEWVDYVEEPLKYQVFMHHFFYLGGWLEVSWDEWWWGGWGVKWVAGVVDV